MNSAWVKSLCDFTPICIIINYTGCLTKLSSLGVLPICQPKLIQNAKFGCILKNSGNGKFEVKCRKWPRNSPVSTLPAAIAVFSGT